MVVMHIHSEFSPGDSLSNVIKSFRDDVEDFYAGKRSLDVLARRAKDFVSSVNGSCDVSFQGGFIPVVCAFFSSEDNEKYLVREESFVDGYQGYEKMMEDNFLDFFLPGVATPFVDSEGRELVRVIFLYGQPEDENVFSGGEFSEGSVSSLHSVVVSREDFLGDFLFRDGASDDVVSAMYSLRDEYLGACREFSSRFGGDYFYETSSWMDCFYRFVDKESWFQGVDFSGDIVSLFSDGGSVAFRAVVPGDYPSDDEFHFFFGVVRNVFPGGVFVDCGDVVVEVRGSGDGVSQEVVWGEDVFCVYDFSVMSLG